MAEVGAAAAAITTTVLKLSELLYNEANFLLDVKDGIERLKRELSWMQSFLKDADDKFDNSNLIREWVSDVRDLAFEAEDVIDTFLLKLDPIKQTDSCCYCISFMKNVPITHKLGCQLDKLMVKATDISSRRERYGLNTDVGRTRKPAEKLIQLRASTPYSNKEHMVGLDETVRFLENKLTNGGRGRFVVSILGMGGLGKTTLARRLYNELREGYFRYQGWICVSQEYNTKDILLQLIQSMINPTKEDLEKLTTKDSMEEYLRNFLCEDSFLVVIDDIWEREAWESLERAFPNNNKNSRVIMTTRIRHVAELNSAYVHELRYLNEDESWALFCCKAFSYDDGKCPSILEELGKQMVVKCSGLPLALVTLGGLLSTKSQEIGAWESVRDNLWKKLNGDTLHIDAVLTLSFKDLPHHLKQCLLYVSMFTEDFKIPVSKLMLLWEAEGFIEPEEACAEDIAKSYFNELVGRSLIQKTDEDWIGSTCRVHDLLRDLAIMKAKDVCFSAFCEERRTFGLLKVQSHRRLAIYNLPLKAIPRDYTNPSLRTFFLGKSGSFAYELLRSIHGRFSLLRVLDIAVEGEMCNLKLDKLIHLRYLGIECNSSVELPETLGSLKCLETISIKSHHVVTLGRSVMKLRKLKHLIGNFKLSDCSCISELSSLEELGLITYKNWCELDATNLVNLRHLSLSYTHELRRLDYATFCSNLKKATRLRTLALEHFFSMVSQCQYGLEFFEHCPGITHFKAHGSFNIPTGLEFGVNLQILEIEEIAHLDYDPMPLIERLPRLRALRITVTDYTVSDLVLEMFCSDGGCPQLQTLDMDFGDDTDGFRIKLSVAEGGMPLLTNLRTNKPQYITAPDRIKQLISVTL